MDRAFIDEETGESLDHLDYEMRRFINSVNNAETGEPEVNIVEAVGTAKTRRVPFQIPMEVKRSLSRKEATNLCNDLTELEPVPVRASLGQINPICLFLPAILYFRWCLALLMILEAVIHVWAHRKNKGLKDACVYYRSPLHAISSEFCALCQSETCMNRVGKMQQIRMHKFLKQCNYMKRVVT